MIKTRFVQQMNEALKSLETTMKNNGVPVSEKLISGTYSQEGFDTFQSDFDNQTQGLRDDLSRELESISEELGKDNMSMETSEPMRAGLIAAIASQNPSAYHREAIANKSEGMMTLESIYTGLGGNIDVAEGDAYSQESFDTNELANFTAQNIMFNVLASRQDSFAEGFFPTKVMTPSEGGITITVDRQEVTTYPKHKTDGSLTDRNRQNLIDAFSDHNILNQPATELVPWAKEDGSNASNFVDEQLISSTVRDIAGSSVRTRPLREGKRMNFLGLSQHPGLLENGMLDTTDQIAHGMRVSNLYMRLTDGENTEVVVFNVEHHIRNEFRKSTEGQGREVVLNFISSSLPLDSNIKTVGGAPSALLNDPIYTEDLVARLGLSVNGNANLDDGNLEIHASAPRVEMVLGSNGDKISMEQGNGKTIVDKLESLNAEIIGYDLGARRSNSNWRTTGPLIDVTPYTEAYAIEPGYPISVLTPTDENQNGAKISGMINAVRIRNSNNAVTTLFNYAEQLSAFKDAMKRGSVTDIVGAGRWVVKPFYEEINVDVLERINSLSSHHRDEDISKVLIDAIRDQAYRMFRDSNYGPALDLANAGTGNKATLLIGTDVVVQRWLFVTANEGPVGQQMDFQIVSTNDNRLDDTIFLTFTRGRPGSEDGLSFGVHAYVPELIQRVTTQRNGSTSKNDRVIPRNIHVPVLPVLSKLNIVNLQQAIANLAG